MGPTCPVRLLQILQSAKGIKRARSARDDSSIYIYILDYQMRAKARILGAKARFNPKRRLSPFNSCRSKFQLHFEFPLTPCWLYLTSVTDRWVLKPKSFPILCFFEPGRWSAPLIKSSRRFDQYIHAVQRLFFTEFAIVFTKCGTHFRCIWATFLGQICHFGSSCHRLGRSWEAGGQKAPEILDSGVPLGSLWAPILTKIRHLF